MKPERTLVLVAGGDARGSENLDQFDDADFDTEVTMHRGLTVQPQMLANFVSGADVYFCVETPSCHSGFDIIRDEGTRSVLLANPELFQVRDHGWPEVLRVPTSWALDRMMGAKVLPQPVALDRFTQRQRDSVTCFYHPSAPAMRDRNGTDLLLAALEHLTEACRVLIRTPHMHGTRRVGPVTVEFLDPHPGDYWESYPDEADVMVLPRRYGGLSLSVMEAAACGMPSVMLDVHPATEWPGVALVPTAGHVDMQMKGGVFPVWQAQPQALAAIMDQLVRCPEQVSRLSYRALEWASANSWDALMPDWLGTLR